jgi:hypothetical protein
MLSAGLSCAIAELKIQDLEIFAGKQFKKPIHNPLPEILSRLPGPDIFTGLPSEPALIIEFDLPAVFRLPLILPLLEPVPLQAQGCR